MTNQDLKYIKTTISWMLENGEFEDSETAYNSAMNSIDVLKEAILVTRCCTQLNGKKVIPFDDWIDLKKYTQLTPNLYKKEQTYFNHESLFRQYKKEQGI
jgi:hypothetical protein